MDLPLSARNDGCIRIAGGRWFLGLSCMGESDCEREEGGGEESFFHDVARQNVGVFCIIAGGKLSGCVEKRVQLFLATLRILAI